METLESCPDCGSSEGFRIKYTIRGSGYEDRDFQGNFINANKNEFHDDDKYVMCLSCGTQIHNNKVKTD